MYPGSQKSVHLKTSSVLDLHRKITHNDPDFIFERVVPKDCCLDTINAIQTVYQIDIDEHMYFTDFSTAGEYFCQ